MGNINYENVSTREDLGDIFGELHRDKLELIKRSVKRRFKKVFPDKYKKMKVHVKLRIYIETP